jgi:16S rRNA (cytosine1402-N4)-methyltransferase
MNARALASSSASGRGHVPVLLDEAIAALAPREGETLIDATFGGGGYSRAILAVPGTHVIAIDRDLDAIQRAEAMAAETRRLTPLLGRFGDVAELAGDLGLSSVDGIVLDIGVSSFQIDEAARGFSFQKDGPLDMRMGASGPTAADVVARMDERALAGLIFRLGEEKQSRRIAKFLVERRRLRPFKTTLDLADAVEAAVGGRRGERIHPATQTFQALRMYVNDELGELARAVTGAERLLRPGGRLVIVSFHSLEDRLVKAWLRERAGRVGAGSRHIPLLSKSAEPTFELVFSKAVTPAEKELETNPRARSAKLRAAIRTGAPARPEIPDDGLDLPPLSDLED